MKKTLIFSIVAGLSLASTLYAENLPGLQYMQLEKKTLTKAQVTKANSFYHDNAYYFKDGMSASVGIMNIMNTVVYDASKAAFDGTCTANVDLANNSAITALNAVNKTKFSPTKQLQIGKDNISVGAVEGLLVAAATATEANTVAINTFNKCNESSNSAMQYLNDILVVGTTALSTLHPPA